MTDWGPVTRLGRRLRAFPAAYEKAADELDGAEATRLLGEIQDRAPVRTGAYRASWYIVKTSGGWRVATDHPAAMRLEHGFHGVDALGRNYNQEGTPHVAPAVALVRVQFKALKRDLVKQVWRSL